MISGLFENLQKHISIGRIEKFTRQIHQLEGNQSFRNYKSSTDLYLELMADSGFEQITRYALPADGKFTVFDCTMPQAWETTGRSFLRLEDENIPEDQRLIADSCESPFVPGVWSGPTPEEGIDCLLIPREEALKNPERIAGNMVYMASFDSRLYQLTAEQGGAGVVMTYPPIAEEFPDDYRWNNGVSFCGWYHTAGEKRISLFSLTPRRAALVEKYLTCAGIPIHAEVRTQIHDGEVYTLTGILPGKTAEEITLIAHMYEPFLPDDAAGGVIICELCRALKELIGAGKLPPLEKTLRIVLSFERYGFSEFFLDRERNARTLAVISMDSACHFPGSGTFPETKLRLSSIIQPSFLDLWLPDMYRKLLKHRRLMLEKGNLSDDTFCSDDWIGIPSIWFHSADKKYHHCSCPKFMDANWELAEDIARFAGAATGALASGDKDFYKNLASACKTLAQNELDTIITQVKTDVAQGTLEAWEGAEKIRFHGELADQRLFSLNRFSGGSADREKDCIFARQAGKEAAALYAGSRPAPSGSMKKAAQITVERLIPNTLMSLARAPLNDRRNCPIPDTLYILMDGKRSVYDAVKLYEYHFEEKYTESQIDTLLEYLSYLEKYGYVKITPREARP